MISIARVLAAPWRRAALPRMSSVRSGVFLLRHGRGAGRVGFGQIEEGEFSGGVEGDFLGEARDVQAERGACLAEVEQEVAVAGRVHRIGGGGGEAEFACGDGAVEREGRAGDGSGAERAEIHAGACVGEAAEVALEHGNIGKQPVGDQDRLGALEMGVAGHHLVAGLLGEVEEGFGPGLEAGEDFVDRVADEEAHVSRDLLVAAAAGVQLEG